MANGGDEVSGLAFKGGGHAHLTEVIRAVRRTARERIGTYAHLIGFWSCAASAACSASEARVEARVVRDARSRAAGSAPSDWRGDGAAGTVARVGSSAITYSIWACKAGFLYYETREIGVLVKLGSVVGRHARRTRWTIRDSASLRTRSCYFVVCATRASGHVSRVVWSSSISAIPECFCRNNAKSVTWHL